MKRRVKEGYWEMLEKRFVQNVLLSLLSAVLFYFMVGFKLYFLVWIVLVPIFYVGLRERRLFLLSFYGFLTAFFIFTFSFFWLSMYSMTFFWMSSLIVGFFGVLIIIFYSLLCRIKKFYDYRFFYFSLIWFILAFIFSFWEYGNMWMLFAYFQPMMFPLGYLFGPLFYTVFIIFFNSLVAYYLFEKKKWGLNLLVLFVILILFSSVYSMNVESSGREISVALVQGNVDIFWDTRMVHASRFLSKYENLTLGLKEFEPDFIFWPEYAIAADLMIEDDLRERIGMLAREMNSYIVVGAFSYVDLNKTKDNDLKYDRIFVFHPNGSLFDFYDSSAVMSMDGDIVALEGSEKLIVTDRGSFRIGLCFEEYMNSENLRRDDSDFIVILSNNQHFDETSGLGIISQFSKLKALEKRKYVLRVANTGITQIVNPYGRVESALEPYSPGVLFGKIYI